MPAPRFIFDTKKEYTEVNRPNFLARLGLALASSLLAAALIPQSAQAADNGAWSVQPTGANGTIPRDWFEYTLKAGETLRDMVSISNLSAAPLSFAIYPTDAYNTPVDAGFAFLQKEQAPKDAGSWIHLGYSQLTVPPRSRADLPFEISVPIDASPGDHTAGIVAQNLNDTSQPLSQGKGVNIKQRVASRIYVRVQGALSPRLQVTRLGLRHSDPLLPPFTGDGRAVVAYQITNIGNVRLTGEATLKLKGLFGRTLKTFKPRQLPELLPKGSVVVEERWSGPLPIIDRIYASVTVNATETSTHRTKASWKIPWLEVLIVAIVILLLVAPRRYRRWRDSQPASPQTPSPTTQEAVLV